MTNTQVKIDVWSDYVCPFCYLEQPVLDRIEKEFAGAVEITWRAFELRPDPEPTLDPKGEYLRDIWARAVYPMADQRGMILRLPPVQPRSRLAHEAVAFARARGKATELNEALFQAFFVSGDDIGELDIILRHAAGLGLEVATLRRALTERVYRDEVLADEELARTLGVSGVPAITVRSASDPIESAVISVGAQPYEAVRKVVGRFADTTVSDADD